MSATLTGRVAVVTGAARGIGRETAILLAAEGARVVVNDIGGDPYGDGANPSEAQHVVDEICRGGGSAVASSASVATDDGARSIVDCALEAFGDLDIVVNNAGSVRPGAFIGLSQQDFEDVVSVHLTGTFNVSRHAALHWERERGRGVVRPRSLIHTSSSAGVHGRPVGHISYAAAKAGVAAMTQVMAIELKDLEVRVNCIVPMARTRLTSGLPGMDDHLFDPRHIAPLAVSLGRADCTFNGQVFSIFGGSVGLYAGWSIAHEERSTEGWTVASLHEAMKALPRRVKVNTQAQLFADLTSQ
jgi:NAD(P)-dependent dehydrogenase (short-subunit alcohol dehydrogenase family)